MQINHLINGKSVLGTDYFETVNPATQEVLAEVASGGEAEVNAAVAAAKAAFPKWANTPAADRAKLIRKLGAVATSIRDVAQVLVDELRAHFGWPHVSLFRVDRDRSRAGSDRGGRLAQGVRGLDDGGYAVARLDERDGGGLDGCVLGGLGSRVPWGTHAGAGNDVGHRVTVRRRSAGSAQVEPDRAT